MNRLNPKLRSITLSAVLAGTGLVLQSGCGTGGGVPQMLEPTKPRMDREREVPVTPVPADSSKK